MNFQIGQMYIGIDPLTNLKGFTIRVIVPVGSHMLKLAGTIENDDRQPLIATMEIYKQGDKNAEESAIS